MPMQGLYVEMGFTKPSRIQAQTLPLILQHPYKSLIAQVRPQVQISILVSFPVILELQVLPLCCQHDMLWHAGTQWQREDYMLRACHAQQGGCFCQSASGPLPVPNQVQSAHGLCYRVLQSFCTHLNNMPLGCELIACWLCWPSGPMVDAARLPRALGYVLLPS